MFIVFDKGKNGQIQPATTTDVVHPLPLVDGLLNALIDVAEFAFELSVPADEPGAEQEDEEQSAEQEQRGENGLFGGFDLSVRCDSQQIKHATTSFA